MTTISVFKTIKNKPIKLTQEEIDLILHKFVKVINTEGQTFLSDRTYTLADAITLAEKLNTDLKILNNGLVKLSKFDKEVYDVKKKLTQKTVKTKQIQINFNISKHDLSVKIAKIKKILEKDNVEIVLKFKTRQLQFMHNGYNSLKEVVYNIFGNSFIPTIQQKNNTLVTIVLSSVYNKFLDKRKSSIKYVVQQNTNSAIDENIENIVQPSTQRLTMSDSDFLSMRLQKPERITYLKALNNLVPYSPIVCHTLIENATITNDVRGIILRSIKSLNSIPFSNRNLQRTYEKFCQILELFILDITYPRRESPFSLNKNVSLLENCTYTREFLDNLSTTRYYGERNEEGLYPNLEEFFREFSNPLTNLPDISNVVNSINLYLNTYESNYGENRLIIYIKNQMFAIFILMYYIYLNYKLFVIGLDLLTPRPDINVELSKLDAIKPIKDYTFLILEYLSLNFFGRRLETVLDLLPNIHAIPSSLLPTYNENMLRQYEELVRTLFFIDDLERDRYVQILENTTGALNFTSFFNTFAVGVRDLMNRFLIQPSQSSNNEE